MRAATIIGGASSTNSRNAADFYATPGDCTVALLKNFQHLFEGSRIWEPACGDGAISKVLEDHRLDVISTDLHDRGYGEWGMNFLTAECNCGSIITNPPFNLAADFIKHAVTKEVPFAMLLKSTYWHAASRYDLFEQTKPMAIIAMTWRPAMSPERGKAATMDFIWTVWDRKPSNKTEYILQRKNKL